jgi:predicted O-methyltransferase YrrM
MQRPDKALKRQLAVWWVMWNKTGAVLMEIEKRANREFLPILGPEKAKVIAETIRNARPTRVLEVGTLIGYSAIVISKELDDKAQLVTIEIHGEEVEDAVDNIRKAATPTKVNVIQGNAIQVIPKLMGFFDFVFLDGEKTEYLDYLRLAEDKLCEGAVIVADNAGIFANQMKNYLDYVRNSGKYSSKYLPVGVDGIEISVKI